VFPPVSLETSCRSATACATSLRLSFCFRHSPVASSASRRPSLTLPSYRWPWPSASSCRATSPISLRVSSPSPLRATEGQQLESIPASALAPGSSEPSYLGLPSISSAEHRSQLPGPSASAPADSHVWPALPRRSSYRETSGNGRRVPPRSGNYAGLLMPARERPWAAPSRAASRRTRLG